MRLCKFWNESVNVKILEDGQHIQKELIVGTPRSTHKWAFKVIPTRPRTSTKGGLWSLGNLPHTWESGCKGLLLTNPSLFAWMCLGIKQIERCLMCAPNQKKLKIYNIDQFLNILPPHMDCQL